MGGAVVVKKFDGLEFLTKAINAYEMIQDGAEFAVCHFRRKRFHAHGKIISGAGTTRKEKF